MTVCFTSRKNVLILFLVMDLFAFHFSTFTRMILGGSDTGLVRGRVNFQKASCTLDASIKIYSYRVDETIACTYRVLENLSRTDESGGLMEDGECDGNAEVDGISTNRRREAQRYRQQ